LSLRTGSLEDDSGGRRRREGEGGGRGGIRELGVLFLDPGWEQS